MMIPVLISCFPHDLMPREQAVCCITKIIECIKAAFWCTPPFGDGQCYVKHFVSDALGWVHVLFGERWWFWEMNWARIMESAVMECWPARGTVSQRRLAALRFTEQVFEALQMRRNLHDGGADRRSRLEEDSRKLCKALQRNVPGGCPMGVKCPYSHGDFAWSDECSPTTTANVPSHASTASAAVASAGDMVVVQAYDGSFSAGYLRLRLGDIIRISYTGAQGTPDHGWCYGGPPDKDSRYYGWFPSSNVCSPEVSSSPAPPALPISDTEHLSQRVTIKNSISGITVCEIEARLEWCWLELSNHVSNYVGICNCKFQLLAGTHVLDELEDQMGLRLNVSEIIPYMEPAFVVHLLIKPIVRKDVTELVDDGVCFKCMREVGVEAHEILELPTENTKEVAAAMRLAGFSLDELMSARSQLGLDRHPPVTNRTLFDSQLKAAGFSAGDFKRAGYHAHQLSEEFLWREPCCAFFTASELRSAGYNAYELYMAWFSIQDLREAGFGLEVEELYTILACEESLRHVQ